MQVNKTNNIVFLKNVESNLIEEAVVILKNGVTLNNNLKEQTNKKEEKNINILKEAELIVNQKIKENDIKFEKYKVNKLEKKIKILKFINSILILLGTIIFFIK